MCRITTMMPTCKISCANKALGNLTFWVCLPKNHANKANIRSNQRKTSAEKTDESETFLRIVLCLFSFTFSTLFLSDHLFPLIIRALRLNSWRWGCLINALKCRHLRQVWRQVWFASISKKELCKFSKLLTLMIPWAFVTFWSRTLQKLNLYCFFYQKKYC